MYLWAFCVLPSLRSTGAYVQILYKIFVHDMIPFGAIFSIFLFAFTGAFYFALRGEEFTETTTTSNCTCSSDENCVENVTTTESTSLNNFPHLTMWVVAKEILCVHAITVVRTSPNVTFVLLVYIVIYVCICMYHSTNQSCTLCTTIV